MMSTGRARAGFSLVEVALALLVVGIGLLTVFSLFPSGLDMNKRAIDDSQAALLAEDVFAGLRWNIATSRWDSAGTLVLPATMYNIWNVRKHDLNITADGQMRTNVYESLFEEGLVDYATRYKLKVDTVGPIKTVRLEIHNGPAGPTNDPMVFYSEIYQTEMTW